MNNIKYINNDDLLLLNKLILKEKKDFNKFIKIGWNKKNIENHFKKDNNFSIAYIYNNEITAILIGEKIIGKDSFDLEVHLMFVSKKMRRNKIGSNLLKYIERSKKKTNISKIYLEVDESNLGAIKFYEKNNFVFFKFRHNYYKDNYKKSNAKCYTKII